MGLSRTLRSFTLPLAAASVLCSSDAASQQRSAFAENVNSQQVEDVALDMLVGLSVPSVCEHEHRRPDASLSFSCYDFHLGLRQGGRLAASDAYIDFRQLRLHGEGVATAGRGDLSVAMFSPVGLYSAVSFLLIERNANGRTLGDELTHSSFTGFLGVQANASLEKRSTVMAYAGPLVQRVSSRRQAATAAGWFAGLSGFAEREVLGDFAWVKGRSTYRFSFGEPALDVRLAIGLDFANNPNVGRVGAYVEASYERGALTDVWRNSFPMRSWALWVGMHTGGRRSDTSFGPF